MTDGANPADKNGAEARGTAFLGLIAFIRQTAGAEALRRVVERAGSETQVVFGERIRKLSWYPYDAYGSFLEAADAELGRGDLSYCVALGEEASQRDLNTIFAFFTRLYGPERLIRACSRVWSQYYRGAGHMEAVSTDPDNTVLRIYDFPGMHPAHCRLMEGWMARAMETIGGRIIEGSEIACPSTGAAYHEFFCRWK